MGPGCAAIEIVRVAYAVQPEYQHTAVADAPNMLSGDAEPRRRNEHRIIARRCFYHIRKILV